MGIRRADKDVNHFAWFTCEVEDHAFGESQLKFLTNLQSAISVFVSLSVSSSFLDMVHSFCVILTPLTTFLIAIVYVVGEPLDLVAGFSRLL